MKTCDEKGRSILSEPASLQESETGRTHWIEFVEKITTSIIILTTKDRPPWKTFDCERRGFKVKGPGVTRTIYLTLILAKFGLAHYMCSLTQQHPVQLPGR